MVAPMMAGNGRIAIVDDDIGMSRAIERLLLTSGWESRTFVSAEDFLGSGSFGDLEFLILDIELPGMSGLELHEHLVATGISLPSIFITAHDRPWLREKAKLAGAVGYFAKPFEGRLLIEEVRRHLKAA